jgi:hypothetical protein
LRTHGYIKHRKANIKHFLAEGFIASVRDPQSARKTYFAIVGRNMMIIVVAAIDSHRELGSHERSNKHHE